MSAWKKAMDYLGLGPDDAYDDYDMQPAEPARGRGYDEQRAPRPARGGYGYDDSEAVPRSAPLRTLPSRDLEPVPARPRPASVDDSTVTPRPARQGSAVRSVPPPAAGEPYTVRPRRFDQAQEVADKFKEGLPVIMNLETAEKEISRRLIDFASGLCYGLNGTMEKVATGVYLLKPPAPHLRDDLDY
ncbi:MAG: cell division protein SepF [Ilumatobacteraceae bacterium]